MHACHDGSAAIEPCVSATASHMHLQISRHASTSTAPVDLLPASTRQALGSAVYEVNAPQELFDRALEAVPVRLVARTRSVQPQNDRETQLQDMSDRGMTNASDTSGVPRPERPEPPAAPERARSVPSALSPERPELPERPERDILARHDESLENTTLRASTAVEMGFRPRYCPRRTDRPSKLVEALGIEPRSENDPERHLRAYSVF